MIAELRTRLGSELDRLSHELTARMPMDLGSGREEAGNDASVELQRVIQRRIRLLGQLVAGLASVDPSTIWPDRAGYGSVVRVRDVATGEEESYTLMAGDFIDLDEGQVSLESPIGYALLGHRTGEQVTVVTPRVERRYEITGLVTLPQKMGLVGGGEEAVALQVA